ncbi:LysR family transcriptional regulator [Roseibium sp. SCP14]|uniref:LysR family transcriptional regulator n=1 Tax=Roseibium sp. SCP14 TaxID=3141375 RepID=UPI0033368179
MNLVDCMKAFAAVVETGSFTKAGERLDTSKTLASKKVQALENHLGTRLLHRTTRSVSLTESGRIYHDRCVQLLDDLEELEGLMQNQVATPRGRLSVTAPTTFGEMYLAPCMPEFRRRYPEVSVDLSLTDRHVDLVEEGFDVAVRIADLPSSSLIARKLAPTAVHICATPDYLARSSIPEHPRDLTSHQCIVDTNFKSGTSWPFHENGQKFSVLINGALSVNSARAVREFVLADAGLALCPGYTVHEEISSGALVPVLTEFNAFEIGVHAVFNSKRNLTPKVRAFVDFLAVEMARVSDGW